MKKLASAAVVAALCTVAWSSSAQEVKFGEKGTIALHAATGSPMLGGVDESVRIGSTPFLGFQTTTYRGTENCNNGRCDRDDYRWTSFYLNPRIHFFPIENLSIGGEVMFATFSGSRIERRPDRTTTVDIDESPTGFGIMPMVGYNIRLGDRFSIWPHGGIGFRRFAWDYPGNDVADSWWFFNADVPFMLHISPHFSFGAGPGATITLSHNRRVETPVGNRDFDHSYTAWRWFNAHLIGYF